ncbi:MAG TPA: sulfite exporter TauE/SafE family protein [Pseudobdellovibrionaceae bacterium]
MEIYGYFASILMGLSLGMIGGGGSILTVPILVYLFSINPLIATSNSLFIVGSTALVGGVLALRRKEVSVRSGMLFALPSFVGVFLAKSILLPKIPEHIFSFQGMILTKALVIMGIFSILMLLASLAMILKKNMPQSADTEEASGEKNKWNSILVQGFLVGCMTGLVGAGGGFLIVPALVNLVGLSMRMAIGTSLMIIAANSLFGFSVALAKGLSVDWIFLGSILCLALIGLVLGSFFSKRVSEKKLKTGFGYFVLVMGTLILLDQITKLS